MVITAQDAKLKPGYKRTEVGMIPEDWEIKAIDEIADVKGGKRLPVGRTLSDNPTPYPYIRITDMFYGGVSLDEIKYVPIDIFPSIKNYRISNSDIFVAVAGNSLGIVGKVPPELNGANLTENADKITNISCDGDYLLHTLLSPRIQRIIDSEKTVGAQPKLALSRIEKFRIALPPNKTEQHAIATALSDVDAMITSLDKLIAKKRNIKQATMQQLLTGKMRLPGFSEEWKTMKLGDIAEVGRGRVISHREINASIAGKYPVYSSQTSSNGIMGYIDTFDFDGEYVTWTTDGVNAGTVFYRNGKFNCTNVCGTIKLKKDNPQFVAMLLNEIAPKYVSRNLANPKLMNDSMKKIKIPLPSFDEQTFIATVISDMDTEISAFEQNRDKTRALKQGMMQELLTGKTRLV